MVKNNYHEMKVINLNSYVSKKIWNQAKFGFMFN